MTNPRAVRWAAPAAGAAVLMAAVLLCGEPVAVGLRRVVLGALAFWWASAVYGPTGAVAAAAVAAFAVPVTAGADAAVWVFYAGAQLLAAYALMRCLLDPTLQCIAAAGAVLAAALTIGAVAHQGPGAARGLAVFAALAALARVVTADGVEMRWRVARASVVSTVLVWVVAAALVAAVGRFVPLPAPAEYGDARGFAVLLADAGAAGRPAPWRSLGVPLLLALVRPWRRRRRYADAVAAAALACLAIPSWRSAEVAGQGLAGLAGVVTLLAVIGAACWDAAAPAWRRRLAAAAVALQIAAAVVFPPVREPQPPAPSARSGPALPPRRIARVNG